jgi:polypeptide N-acetylgalactosaminyltransferase
MSPTGFSPPPAWFDKHHIHLSPQAGDLPKFSDEAPFTIVIVDYNEPLLAKTVDEILKVRSEKLVHEILILDDFSDRPVTYDMFTRDPRISIYRAKERLGLIRARIDGSNLAAGTFMVRLPLRSLDVVSVQFFNFHCSFILQVLIDAHCKPHEDWLYPIDKSLRENYKRILNMQVGLLDGDKWKEMPGGAIGSKAAFYWSLTHFWEVVFHFTHCVSFSARF